MAFDYTTYLATLANLMKTDPADLNFLQILPSCITYAENRIYREADFLSTVVRDSSASFTANSRNFTLPTANGVFNVVRQINAITPVGSTAADGTRRPMTAISPEAMDMFWPSETAPTIPSIPKQFAMLTESEVVVGPAPDEAYAAEVVGTITPTPLSASNPTTYLTLNLWDLFLAASMVFMTGYQSNFGAQADDPRSAMSWETQYQKLFASADLVDARQKFASVSWSSAQPEANATNQRG